MKAFLTTAGFVYVLLLCGTSRAQTNTPAGTQALNSVTSGTNNTGVGYQALFDNTTGNNNTGVGSQTLYSNTTGITNVAIGNFAGYYLTTGSNNIDIGNTGVAAEANTIRIGVSATQTATYIAGIFGATASGGAAVLVDSNGHLGTLTSSRRYKQDIQDMGSTSEAILALRPVTFRYKPEIDPACTPQFGLIAEEVEKVSPDLVVHDAKHQVYTARYEAVNAMLLNEFRKQYERVQNQEKTIAEQQAAIAAQREQIAALVLSQREAAQRSEIAALKVRLEALEKAEAKK